MKDLFKNQGTVSLNLGYGYLSLYELNNLKEGDVIQTANLAGNPMDVTYDNQFICKAEVVVMSDSFGFRVSGFKKEDLTPEQPGIVDNAVEVIPFTIKLDQIKLDLKELKGISVGSLVGLEKEYGLPATVELYAFNTHVASGEFVVIDENYGIKLTNVSEHSSIDTPIRSSGYKLDTSINEYSIKGYDFKRPDKFSRVQIMNFKAVQQIFLSNLVLNIPKAKGYEVTDVDQLAFNEIYKVLEKDHSFIVMDTTDHPNVDRCQLAPSMVDNMNIPVIQIKDSKYPNRPKEIKSWFESWKKKTKQPFEKSIILAYNNKSIFSEVTNEKSIAELIANPVNNAWKNIGGISFKYSRKETSLNKAKIVPDNDMILMAIICKKDDPDSKCYFIYPYITIESVIPLLN